MPGLPGRRGRPPASAHSPRLELTGTSVVFLHAHPDDEAIFTGAIMRRLASQGARVVLVTATAGEEGALLCGPPASRAAEVRTAELERACAELGVARLVLLGYRDSGMAGTGADRHPRAFARHPVVAAARLADLLRAEGAAALVHDDAGGIYGHPDHLAAHRLGRAAVRLTGIPAYETTIDRDALSPAVAHLVERNVPAGRRHALGSRPGQITTSVQATREELQAKHAAMRAHASQIPSTALTSPSWPLAYATEWFIRRGAPTVLDDVAGAASADGQEPGTAA